MLYEVPALFRIACDLIFSSEAFRLAIPFQCNPGCGTPVGFCLHGKSTKRHVYLSGNTVLLIGLHNAH